MEDRVEVDSEAGRPELVVISCIASFSASMSGSFGPKSNVVRELLDSTTRSGSSLSIASLSMDSG